MPDYDGDWAEEYIELLSGASEPTPCMKCSGIIDCSESGYVCPAFESYVNNGRTRRKPKPRQEE